VIEEHCEASSYCEQSSLQDDGLKRFAISLSADTQVDGLLKIWKPACQYEDYERKLQVVWV
jgi:hypothetical protein